jgi:hypothetical protein
MGSEETWRISINQLRNFQMPLWVNHTSFIIFVTRENLLQRTLNTLTYCS